MMSNTTTTTTDTDNRIKVEQHPKSISKHLRYSYMYTENEKFGTTNGRKIARFLSRYKWYNPLDTSNCSAPSSETKALLARDSSKPTRLSLDFGWAYFENNTLPRRLCRDDGRELLNATENIKVESGVTSQKTKLYNPCDTYIHELSDFGIGVGLYFSALQYTMILMIIAGLINLPNMLYFYSSNYTKNTQKMLPWILRGSAICTDEKWVPCPFCQQDSTNSILNELWSTLRIVPVFSSANNETLYFARKNICGDNDDNFLFYQVVTSSIACIFIAVSFYKLSKYQTLLSVKFDERNATSTDFSIEIKNPPMDAIDPDEWKSYLQFVANKQITTNPYGLGVEKAELTYLNTHVTCITVALDNKLLIDSLIQRRQLKKAAIKAIDVSTQNTFDEYHNSALLIWENKESNVHLPKKLHTILNQYIELNKSIKSLMTKRYNATRVFATFETEIGQRAVLTALSASKITTVFNKQHEMQEKSFSFRGEKCLNVHEPMEPLTICWNNLGISRERRMFAACLIVIFSFIFIYAAYIFVKYIWQTYGANTSAIVIAILNMIMPIICRFLTNFEKHDSEEWRQSSLNLKITVFRWINTAIILHIITPFTLSIENGDYLIHGVCSIFIADMFTAPLLQLLNIPGNIKRHFVAPRSKTTEDMKISFSGEPWNLGERYINLSKVLFLCFFFSVLFPFGFFLAALAIKIHFEVDKFNLLVSLQRTWSKAPSLGPQIAKLNHTIVNPILLITLCVMSVYSWSGFPYDNICDHNASSVPSNYVGNHSITLFEGETVLVSTTSNDVTYSPCSQDVLDRVFSYNFDWMSTIQKRSVLIHASICATLIICSILYIFFFSDLTRRLRYLFKTSYEPSGEIYGTNFSNVPGDIFPAYVPQVQMKGMAHPLILSDISGIDHRFVGWKDIDSENFIEHNLFHDISLTSVGKETPIFSIVKYWQPPNSDSL